MNFLNVLYLSRFLALIRLKNYFSRVWLFIPIEIRDKHTYSCFYSLIDFAKWYKSIAIKPFKVDLFVIDGVTLYKGADNSLAKPNTQSTSSGDSSYNNYCYVYKFKLNGGIDSKSLISFFSSYLPTLKLALNLVAFTIPQIPL